MNKVCRNIVVSGEKASPYTTFRTRSALSNAGVARDLRIVIRERLVAGDTDAEVVAYVVDRYGEFVLFRPPARGANLILWVAGPAMLIAGLGIAAVALRRRQAAPPDRLSADEQARLDAILKE